MTPLGANRRNSGLDVTASDGFIGNRHNGLVDVVCLVCLAQVVLAGGVHRPRDVFAIRAFVDDDEDVVHLSPAVVEL